MGFNSGFKGLILC